jgi:hypothetical protein
MVMGMVLGLRLSRMQPQTTETPILGEVGTTSRGANHLQHRPVIYKNRLRGAFGNNNPDLAALSQVMQEHFLKWSRTSKAELSQFVEQK